MFLVHPDLSVSEPSKRYPPPVSIPPSVSVVGNSSRSATDAVRPSVLPTTIVHHRQDYGSSFRGGTTRTAPSRISGRQQPPSLGHRFPSGKGATGHRRVARAVLGHAPHQEPARQNGQGARSSRVSRDTLSEGGHVGIPTDRAEPARAEHQHVGLVLLHGIHDPHAHVVADHAHRRVLHLHPGPVRRQARRSSRRRARVRSARSSSSWPPPAGHRPAPFCSS